MHMCLRRTDFPRGIIAKSHCEKRFQPNTTVSGWLIIIHNVHAYSWSHLHNYLAKVLNQ